MCLLAGLPMAMKAQENVTNQSSPSAHLKFRGIPIAGTIDDFSEKMQPRFTLKKKRGAENHFIFEGPIYGYNMLLQVYYTDKTRTAYRVVVSPKHMDIETLKDSLKHDFGEPEVTAQGSLWKTDEGIILHYTPEGYDTALIFLDAQGNQAYSEEKKK